jgi:hypothetical protein
MTRIEFMKSQLSKIPKFGDLVKDIQGEKEFPASFYGIDYWALLNTNP